MLGPPPGAVLVWEDPPDSWPLLSTDAGVPAGTRYFFTADQLVTDAALRALFVDKYLPRYLARAGVVLRRLFFLLSLVPLAWTAPDPATPFRLERYMTIPAPPPRLPIPLGVQLTVRMDQNGQPAVVVLGGLRDGTQDLAPTMASAWLGHFWASFRAGLSSSLVVQGATLRDVAVVDGTVFEVGPPASPGGAAVDDLATAASSALIKWSTAQGGRSGKGRTFLPGLGRGSIGPNGRAYSAGAVSALQTSATAYLTSRPAPMPAPAVLSFTKGAAYPILSGSPSAVIGLQRRRMRA